MEPMPIPKTITIYQLIRQSGMNFTPTGTLPTPSIGTGFYLSRTEAEHNRTLELLKDSSHRFHVFELEVPNPAYKE
jgi:hypothetical protein